MRNCTEQNSKSKYNQSIVEYSIKCHIHQKFFPWALKILQKQENK
ncbi:MAG: hypothetical protein PHY59_03675 [Methanobacterium sp.]|nr:hypothetical protein [Methanobacterium sp.]